MSVTNRMSPTRVVPNRNRSTLVGFSKVLKTQNREIVRQLS